MVVNKVDLKMIVLKKVKYLILVVFLLLGTAGYVVHERNAADEEILVTEPSQETEQAAQSSEEVSKPDSTDDQKADTPETVSPEYIYVDVSGAVNTPMVVCIPAGSRVFEAIEAAGGRTSESSVKYINLASVCEDGQKIYVPTMSETDAAEASGSSLPDLIDAPSSADTSGGSTQGSGQSSSPGASSSSGSKVNINTAGSEELQTLTGVGPAIASRIIDYRNTRGSFQSTEELKSVSGIGEKIYEKLKDEICV